MKISPAANELVERGIRTGTKPASMAISMPTPTCHCAARGRPDTATAEYPTTAVPMSTTAHQ